MVAHDDIRAGTDMCVCESVCACSQSLQVMLMVRVWTVFQCCTGVGEVEEGGNAFRERNACTLGRKASALLPIQALHLQFRVLAQTFNIEHAPPSVPAAESLLLGSPSSRSSDTS